jgi:hypothetical protein
MSRPKTVAVVLAFTTLLLGPATAADVDIATVAQRAVARATTATGKVRAAVSWTHANFSWTYTDHKKRTVEEIVARGGGNCFEQTEVVRAILDRAGVRTRAVHEVNIQPKSAARSASSEDLMATNGDSASVYGFQHNDHVWIEYWDDQAREWQPADPTIGIVGIAQWEAARAGFGARPVHDVIPFHDMLVPIGIFAIGADGRVSDDRSRHYLIDGFARYVPGASRTRAWPQWVHAVEAESEHVGAAMRGRYDLHRDDEPIDRLRLTYTAMRAEASGKAHPS